MYTIIRKQKFSRKRFVGFIGTFLIETLDDDPIISKFINKNRLTQYRSKYPVNSTRFLGPTSRMILKSHDADALIILIDIDSECQLFHFLNRSKYSNQQILSDALKLASFKWSSFRIDGISFPLKRNVMLQMKEIQAILSSLKN
jgi:hypothetical protein